MPVGLRHCGRRGFEGTVKKDSDVAAVMQAQKKESSQVS